MVCKRCNGSGIDPERIERVFYTKDGDVDVGYDPQLCRDCYVSKYLEFHKIGQKPKTDVWEVLNKKTKELLGVVKWYAPWRQYCFFTENEIIFSIGCMKDILQFLNIQGEHHKLKRKLKKGGMRIGG